MVTLTFSALSSGFPLPCRQQDPQRAAPWSCSSSGGCHTHGSSQLLSQRAAPHSSHICGRKEGVQRHTDVKQNWNTTVPLFAVCTAHLPWFHSFCSTHQGQQARALHPPEQNRLSSTWILILPAQTSPALCWDQASIHPKRWGLDQGEADTDTSKPISHGPDCKILIYSKHDLSAEKTLLIFLMLQCKENSIQAWTQILPADFQASASPIPEELLQTWVKIQPSKAKK